MRKQTNYWRVAQNPKFVAMVQGRRRVTRVLSWLVLSVFAVYTLSMIYTPELLGRPIMAGSAVTIGVAFSFFFIVFGVVLSGYYTWWANNKFDPLQHEVVAEFKRDQHAE